MANLALEFNVLARDQASQKFRDIGNAADRAGRQTSNFGSTVASGLKIAAGAFLGAGLVQGFQALYNAADEARKISALTTQVIKTTGGAANVSAKQVGDLAAAIAKKTGVDDEAIQSGQNLLLTFTNVRNEVGKGNDIFNRATQTITDMSVALGQDTTASATQLGKALNDPIRGVTALQRVGVSFTASQREQIKVLVESGQTLEAQKIILDELGKEFGGAAEAAATPLDKLRQRAGDFAEQLGGYLLPAVDKFATFASEKLLPALQDIGGFINAVAVPAFTAIATVVGTVADVFNALPGPLQAAVVALGALAVLRGPVSGALETIGLRALYMKDALSGASFNMGGLKSAAGGVVGLFGGPWGVALAAGTIMVGSFMSQLKDAEAGTERWTQALLKGGAAARQAREEYNNGDYFLRSLDEWTGLAPSLEEAEQAARDYFNTLSPMEQAQSKVSYWTEELAYRMEHLGGTHENTRIAQERLAHWTDILGEREGYLEAATASVAGTTEDFATKIEAARTELDEGKQAIDDFRLSLDLLSGNTVSLIQVESAFQSAVAQASSAINEMGGEVLTAAGTLNLQSENGRKAADVLLDVRNSGNDLIATMIQQGATAEQVQAKDAQLRQSFINTAIQMGISETAALDLANQILGIPAERETEIRADTAQANSAIAQTQSAIDNMRGRTIEIGVRIAGGTNSVFASMGSTFEADGSIIEAYANGGLRSMGSGVAKVVPPGTLRVIGDNPVADEAFIPLNGSARSKSILSEAASRMGFGLMPMAAGGINLTTLIDTHQADNEISAIKTRLQKLADGGVAGGGALGGSWVSIWNAVKAAIPQARQNSTYRPGDPGYHGRNKAIDFGFGSGPGGAGSAGLALINRFLHDRFGRNLAELIYDGIGDDRPDLKNGRPLTYNAATRSQHRNHVHAAVYGEGTNWVPETGLALVHRGEAIVPASQNQGAPYSAPAVNVRVFIGERELTDIVRVEIDNDAGALASDIHYGRG